MKPIALDSRPEEPHTNDSRARAGRFDSTTASPTSCLRFTYCVSSEYLNESVDAIACTSASCTSVDQCNQLYSIYALSDSSGNVSERYAYTAYGQPTFLNASATVQTSSAAGNRYTYTAREWDPTIGLSYFRERWMSGLSGRFVARDPIGYKGSQWCLYELGHGSPHATLDPKGENCLTKNRSNKQCCEDAGNDPLISLNSIGGVICCDGRKVPCAWKAGIMDPPELSANGNVRNILTLCVLVHEKVHADFHTPSCDPNSRLERMRNWRNVGAEQGECEAYERHLLCLLAGRITCTTDRCREWLDLEIESVRDRAAESCGRWRGVPRPGNTKSVWPEE